MTTPIHPVPQEHSLVSLNKAEEKKAIEKIEMELEKKQQETQAPKTDDPQKTEQVAETETKSIQPKTAPEESQETTTANDDLVANKANTEAKTEAKTEKKPDEWQVDEVAKAVATAKNNEKEAEKPDKITIPGSAWIIQLGAFKNAVNINALVEKLRVNGYQANTMPRDVVDGELTRIFIGPEIEKSKLEKQLSKLKKLTDLEGEIIKFKATAP